MLVRDTPTILHVDLDAFFAAVEQRDKPSLAGRPVVVGGIGPRGVVATASYEARAFGVSSAMPTAQARRLCPHAAFLSGRMSVYTDISRSVMRLLAEVTPTLEPVSLDEAFLDLRDAPGQPSSIDGAPAIDPRAVAAEVRSRIRAETGLTASVGAASSKLLAKIASDLAKPDGVMVVPPGEQQTVLDPLAARVLPGVGPATEQQLSRIGIATVADLRAMDRADLVGLLGQAQGESLSRMARGEDDRHVKPERESKSVSVEDTFEHDIADPAALRGIVARLAERVAVRLRAAGLSGRTITVKARTGSFRTKSRSTTLVGPVDDDATIVGVAVLLLDALTDQEGLRLLGVAVSGLGPWRQEALFPDPAVHAAAGAVIHQSSDLRDQSSPGRQPYQPGQDVEHRSHGRGWVWGSGRGRVTVRFETATTGPGAVRTVPDDEDMWPYPAVDSAEKAAEAPIDPRNQAIMGSVES